MSTALAWLWKVTVCLMPTFILCQSMAATSSIHVVNLPYPKSTWSGWDN